MSPSPTFEAPATVRRIDTEQTEVHSQTTTTISQESSNSNIFASLLENITEGISVTLDNVEITRKGISIGKIIIYSAGLALESNLT